MTTTIEKLRGEHANLAKLMMLLKREMTIFKEGGSPDFDLVADILDYNSKFPDACHHPKENVILNKLRERDPEAAKAVGNLDSEHDELHTLTLGFSTAVQNVMNDRELPRDWFSDVADEYFRFLQRHMRMEEVVFFPAALRAFSEDDWKQVDAHIFNEEDPVFSKVDADHFESLRQAITNADNDLTN